MTLAGPRCLQRYRDNRYLAARGEQAANLRIFSVDHIRHFKPLPEPARKRDPVELDPFLGTSLDIFSGSAGT